MNRFSRRIAATAAGLVPLRAEFAAWLGGLEPRMTRMRRDDIVLASYEAMANAVEHGYRDGADGQVSIEANYLDETLTVTVCDSGSWKPPTDDPFRGRGLRAISAVSDHDEIVTGEAGTRVTMTWYRPPVAAD